MSLVSKLAQLASEIAIARASIAGAVTIPPTSNAELTAALQAAVTTAFSAQPMVIPLAVSAVPITGSAITAEEVYANIAIPANIMGPYGQLRITLLWSSSSNVNAKGLRVRFGGPAGQLFLGNNIASNTASNQTIVIIRNRGSTSSQVGHGQTLTVWGGTGNAAITSAVDTTQIVQLVIAGEKGVAADLLRLDAYSVELIRP